MEVGAEREEMLQLQLVSILISKFFQKECSANHTTTTDNSPTFPTRDEGMRLRAATKADPRASL